MDDGLLITPSTGVPKRFCKARTVAGPRFPSCDAPTLRCKARTVGLPLLPDVTPPYKTRVTLFLVCELRIRSRYFNHNAICNALGVACPALPSPSKLAYA